MNKLSFYFFYFLIAPTTLFAQKKLPVFGQIDITDLLLKFCPFEPDAPAIKLLDVQETTFELNTYGTRLKSERRVRIKIFNERGYKYAAIKIPYFSKKGVAKIKELNGRIYNLETNGKISIQKLEKRDFFKDKIIENVGLINFTFPSLKPGSIIEYTYATIENDLIYIAPWFIQDEIPVLFTSRTITTPVESKIFEKVFGIDTIEQKHSLLKYNMFRKIIYFKENIPSFKAEPYMSSKKDNLMRVSFLLFPLGAAYYISNRSSQEVIWKVAGTQFLNSIYFEKQVKNPIPGTEKIIDSANTILSIEQRISFIYNEVKKRIPDKIEQEINPGNLTEAWESKTGNSAEINLILLNLLDKANIKCLPILVSTRENGKISKDFPSLGQLNGIDVLVMDSSKYYILDASLKFQSIQNPPLNILNREAFILSPDSMQWVTISDVRPLLNQTVFVMADLNEEGKIEGTGTLQYFDYAKAYKLDTTLKSESNNEDAFFDKTPLGLKILSSRIENTGDDRDPLFETINFNFQPPITNDFLFLNPLILIERNKNVFIAEKRNTEIDFGCNQLFIYNMIINLPPSYEIEYLPKNKIVRAPDSSFFFKITYTIDSQKIHISHFFETKRAIYSKEEYPGLQDFFKRMYALMSEEIILRKKK
jgi:hypothetical protein